MFWLSRMAKLSLEGPPMINYQVWCSWSQRPLIGRLIPFFFAFLKTEGEVSHGFDCYLTGLSLDPKPSFSQASQSDFDGSETEKSVSYGIGSEDLKDEVHGVVLESKKNYSRPGSPVRSDHSEPGLGWPLLRASPTIPRTPSVHSMSVVQWVMNLPNRSPYQSLSTKGNDDASISKISGFVDERAKGGLSAFSEPPEDLEDLLKTNSSCYKWFSPDVLKTSTSHFSSGF